jgi:hypothetical protein
MKKTFLALVLYWVTIAAYGQRSEVAPSPQVKEGEGPFPHLIIRGATLINGTGAPPTGPVDIVIKQNRIVNIVNVGYPGVPINEERRPKLDPGGREINGTGMYVLPGFVDMHGHIGGSQAPFAEYVFKLWMAHGITTIRDPSAGNGLKWVLDHKKLSAENKITAPRIKAYTAFGQDAAEPISTPEQARAWVNDNKIKGADGIKFFGAAPDIMEAALRENKRLGLRSACHHAQMDVARWDVVKSAEAGLTTMEHWYGLPEALFTSQTIQNYPLNYNYANEQDRFEHAGSHSISHWIRLTTLMKPVAICIAHAARSGMRPTPFRSCGHSINPTGYRMDRTGSIGEPSKKLPGERTSGCGWPS